MSQFSRLLTLVCTAFFATLMQASAIVDDARSFAIEAALPYLEVKPEDKEKPFAIRDAWWNGDAKVKDPQIFRHQLFKRNEYWFWAACSDMEATVSIAVYDSAGKLVTPVEKFNTKHTAGVKVAPKTTGTYFIRVVIESASTETAHWAVVYGYR